MKRKLAWLGVALLFVGIPATAFWLLPKDRINQDTYDQIRLGMTIGDVRTMLGAPGDDITYGEESPGKREIIDDTSDGTWERMPGFNNPGRKWKWTGQDGAIVIGLDQEGQVTGKQFLIFRPLTLIERVRMIVSL